jgi:hypothetical protein
MSCRRLCSSCWSWGDESGGLCEGGRVAVDCGEGRRRRMRPGELEGGTAMVSGLVMAMGVSSRVGVVYGEVAVASHSYAEKGRLLPTPLETSAVMGMR